MAEAEVDDGEEPARAGLAQVYENTDSANSIIRRMRLDNWTAQSPRPFLSTEFILHADFPDGERRDEIINAMAIVYDERANSIILFGDVFSLGDLRVSLLDVQRSSSS